MRPFLILAALSTPAVASDITVEVGLLPASPTTFEVPVDGKATTTRFVSGVPLATTVRATETDAGHLKVSVEVVAESGRVKDGSLTRKQRKAIARFVDGAGTLSHPTLLLARGQEGEFIAAETTDDGTHGLKVRVLGWK